ncbi:hypothetical protein ACVWWG_009242 [Bradyrhizobium sp. LB7.2]
MAYPVPDPRPVETRIRPSHYSQGKVSVLR